MVHVTELPTETLQEILYEVCKLYTLDYTPYTRLRKALRLKLVCRRFLEALQPALFESRVADFNDKSEYGVIEAWPVTTYPYGTDKFIHSYLAYHTRRERDPRVGRFVDLRTVAQAFCAETGENVDACIDKLVWLVLDRGAAEPGLRSDRERYKWTWKRCQWSSQYRRNHKYACHDFVAWETEFELNINLLSAAAYFNCLPMAKRLLAEGYCPTTHNDLLPAPMETAAFAGNAEMLQLLQDHLPEFKDLGIRESKFRFRSKVHYSSLLGAALRGDIEIMKLALYPPSRANQDSSTDILDQRYGCVDPESFAGYAIRHAIWNTRDWDIYQCLVSAFGDKHRPHDLEGILGANVNRGNTEFVRRLVLEGGFEESMKRRGQEYLEDAIRRCHDDLVDFIIDDCGISALTQPYRYCWGRPMNFGNSHNYIAVAARAGSLSLLKKVLAKGASVNGIHIKSWHTGFCEALGREHFDMARFLLTLRNPSRRWKRAVMSHRNTEWMWNANKWRYIYQMPELDSIPRFLDEIWGEELRTPPKFVSHQQDDMQQYSKAYFEDLELGGLFES